MTLDGAAQLAAALSMPERTGFEPCSPQLDRPPVPQPAALWPSSRNVFRQRLTI